MTPRLFIGAEEWTTPTHLGAFSLVERPLWHLRSVVFITWGYRTFPSTPPLTSSGEGRIYYPYSSTSSCLSKYPFLTMKCFKNLDSNNKGNWVKQTSQGGCTLLCQTVLNVRYRCRTGYEGRSGPQLRCSVHVQTHTHTNVSHQKSVFQIEVRVAM